MRSEKKHPLIKVRQYGRHGTDVLVLHGGPGAPGYMVPVARRLADHFRVVEPFQRRSDVNEQLTVQRHVSDLNDVIAAYCDTGRPVLVGHSWGAMLALAYAAVHPNAVAAMVLIGCGTFDEASRQQMEAIRQRRTDAAMQARFQPLAEDYPDADMRLGAMGRLMQQIDSVDLVSLGNKVMPCDAKGHEETWADMLRLQAEGVYPAVFEAIGVPVVMLHGDDDPHPGEMIRDQLAAVMPQLEYTSWPRCGHYPWLEKAVTADFYTVLIQWLLSQNSRY